MENDAADGNPQETDSHSRLQNPAGFRTFPHRPDDDGNKQRIFSTAAIHLRNADFLSQGWGVPQFPWPVRRASTKAAYRFFSNERVDEKEILSGHFQATRDRFHATDGLVLVLHDTTTFSDFDTLHWPTLML